MSSQKRPGAGEEGAPALQDAGDERAAGMPSGNSCTGGARLAT